MLEPIMHLSTGSVVGWLAASADHTGRRSWRGVSETTDRWQEVDRRLRCAVEARPFVVMPVDPVEILDLVEADALMPALATLERPDRFVFELDLDDDRRWLRRAAARALREHGLGLGVRLRAAHASAREMLEIGPVDMVRFDPDDCECLPVAEQAARRHAVIAMIDRGAQCIAAGADDVERIARLRREGIRLAHGRACRTVEKRPSPLLGGSPSLPYPIPALEADRVAAVRRAHPGIARVATDLGDVVRSAAARCATPLALLTIIEADRQIVVAAHGLDGVSQTGRAEAFCAHTICGAGHLAVSDAWADDRFCSNPLVLDAPYIRSYLGVPLVVAEGIALGALCVLDREPRRFTSEDVDGLTELAERALASIRKHSVSSSST